MVSVNEWSNRWLVTFNPTKTESMVISRKRQSIQPSLNFDNVQLVNLDSHKHLGITFKSDLTWNIHIQNLIQSGKKIIHILRGLQYSLQKSTF